MPNLVEMKAISTAIRYFKDKGYVVQNVSRIRGHNGYDLIVTRRRKNLKVEVKGCTRMWQIPDPYVTEFDAKKRLVADFLCVVYFIKAEPTKICMIPRKAILPEHVIPKSGYRIRSTFKKQSVLGKSVKDVR